MTTSISSDAPTKWNGQTGIVSYRADVQSLLKRKEREIYAKNSKQITKHFYD